MARKTLLERINIEPGVAHGVHGFDQFVECACVHVISKVGKMLVDAVGLYLVEACAAEEYIVFVERAVNSPVRISMHPSVTSTSIAPSKLPSSVKVAWPTISLTNSSSMLPLCHVTWSYI